MPVRSLKEKTVKGVGWSAAETLLVRGVSFLVGIVLARLLTPSEYGLIGIVLIFTTILEGFVDSGFSSSLIRKKEVSDEDYNTMFITNMVVSVLMFIILYSCAPLIANFFNHPELILLTRVMGLLIIFQALSIVQDTILNRRIDFKTKTKAAVFSAAVSGVVGIAMAFSGCGVWSLVGQKLSRQLLYTICLWVLNRWLPNFKFNISSFRYMWGFGWKMLVSGLLDRIWNQLNQTVIGKYYSPATLGQYTRASEFANLLSSNITSVVQRVSYPVLAQVQDDKKRMIGAYRKVIKTTMFLTAVCLFSLGAVSEPFLYCLIGPQWGLAAKYLPYICVFMSLYPLQAINLNMLKVQGRSDLFLYLEIIKKIIAIGPICLGIFVGIFWMLIGSIVVGVISFFLNSYYTGRDLGYSSFMQLKDVAPGYGIAITIALSVYFLKYLPFSYWIILPAQVVVGAIIFFFICEKSQNPEYLEIKGIIKQFLLKKQRK